MRKYKRAQNTEYSLLTVQSTRRMSGTVNEVYLLLFTYGFWDDLLLDFKQDLDLHSNETNA